MSNINHEILKRRMIRDIITTDRGAYLQAVANHHVRVAKIATDMYTLLTLSQLLPDKSASNQVLEEMAAEIEKSHIEVFGVPTTGELELNL